MGVRFMGTRIVGWTWGSTRVLIMSEKLLGGLRRGRGGRGGRSLGWKDSQNWARVERVREMEGKIIWGLGMSLVGGMKWIFISIIRFIWIWRGIWGGMIGCMGVRIFGSTAKCGFWWRIRGGRWIRICTIWKGMLRSASWFTRKSIWRLIRIISGKLITELGVSWIIRTITETWVWTLSTSISSKSSTNWDSTTKKTST